MGEWDYYIRIQEDGETMFVDEVTEDDFTITLVPETATVFDDWKIVNDLRKRYPDINFQTILVNHTPKGYTKTVG